MNPGADATLVNVAYRAALANTPADYGKTLQSSVDSYEKTMKASADMWGNIAMIGATIGKEMIDSAQEVTDSIALGNTLNSEDTKMFTNEFYSLKDQLKDLGTFNGQFGDRETRQKRAEIKIKQKELFAEIDGAVLNLKAGAEAIAAGTLDQNLLGIGEQEKLNAIVKSNTKNKVTEGGNVAKLSRDETTGELVYKLYNNETGLPFELGGKHQTMTLKQFNESIATNVGDGGAMGNNLNKYNNQRSTLGSKSIDGVYDEELKQADLNYLDGLIGNKPVDLKRAMKTKFGFSNTSFFDDITKNQGEHSADLYNTLLQATGGGDVLTGDITDGMTDTDGVEGISQKEAMNPENYKILTANIVGLKDPEATKDYFKEYTVKNFEAAFQFGYRKREIKGVGDGGGGSDKLTWVGSNKTLAVQGGNRFLDYDIAKDMYDSFSLAKDGEATSFNMFNVAYRYDPKNNNWTDSNGDSFGNSDQLRKILGISEPDFKALTLNAGVTPTGEEEVIAFGNNTPEIQTNKTIFTALDVRSGGTRKDDKASKNLNAKFGLDDRSDVMFVPYSGDAVDRGVFGVGTNILNADAAGTNDIMLFDPGTKEVIRDENDDIIRFPTGNDAFVKGDGPNPTAAKIIKLLKEKYKIEYDPLNPK